MRLFKIILLLITFCITSTVQAQFKQMSEGPQFEEPVDGFAKILQLKNGNTFYAHVTMKNGINIRIYNANHTETKATTIQTSY